MIYRQVQFFPDSNRSIHYPFKYGLQFKNEQHGLIKDFSIVGSRTNVETAKVTLYSRSGTTMWEGNMTRFPRYVYLDNMCKIEIRFNNSISIDDPVYMEWYDIGGISSQLCDIISCGKPFILREDHLEWLRQSSLLHVEFEF
jgi:hypothetical protein